MKFLIGILLIGINFSLNAQEEAIYKKLPLINHEVVDTNYRDSIPVVRQRINTLEAKYKQVDSLTVINNHTQLKFLSMANQVGKGKVKFFKPTQGYGFIVEDGTNTEYFFHVTKVLGEVKKDDLVTFQIIKSTKGLQAIDVKLT